MKPKGGKLPSVSLEGTSSAKVAFVEGKIVKVCGNCESVLDRVTGLCANCT